MPDELEIMRRLHDSEMSRFVEVRRAIGGYRNGRKLRGNACDTRTAIYYLAENAFAEFPKGTFAVWWASSR
jgi:hypothetical protein